MGQQMTLDPRVSVYLNLIVIALTSLIGGTVYWDSLFSADVTAKILAILGLVILVLNAILHAIPSTNNPDDSKKFFLGPKK